MSAAHKPQRVQLSRERGWRMPPNTVKVDRSTSWGNPFQVGKPVHRGLAHLWGWRLKNLDYVAPDAEAAVRRFATCVATEHAVLPHIRRVLGGKNLACWCPPGSPCHADVLLRLANPPRAAVAASNCNDCGKRQGAGEPLSGCDVDLKWRCEPCATRSLCRTEPHEEGCATLMWSDADA